MDSLGTDLWKTCAPGGTCKHARAEGDLVVQKSKPPLEARAAEPAPLADASNGFTRSTSPVRIFDTAPAFT
ncbi:hypothetical protein [Streptomyces sp. NPDC014623]|uniref:hypothetical protein n=1 Tax=Streptomyces sp. NPDC014623 TaxID=3364875 RepID=UPI0036FFCD86